MALRSVGQRHRHVTPACCRVVPRHFGIVAVSEVCCELPVNDPTHKRLPLPPRKHQRRTLRVLAVAYRDSKGEERHLDALSVATGARTLPPRGPGQIHRRLAALAHFVSSCATRAISWREFSG